MTSSFVSTDGQMTHSGVLHPPGVLTRVRHYLPLLKLNIIVLLTAYGLAAALVAGAGRVPLWRLAIFTVLGLMSSGGAACLNHLFERDIDARMERTKRRPLPSGKVTPQAAAMLATVLLGVSIPIAWLALGPVVAVLMAAGAAIYGGLYTLVLKPRTSQNIVIGGAAGSMAALAGWAVVDPSLALGSWLLALIVFLWTPPHFWGLAIARDADYRAAKIPMLPQVAGVGRTARAMVGYAIAMLIVSLLVAQYTVLGTFYVVSAGMLGAGLIAACAGLWARPSTPLAMKVFKSSGMYLLLLVVAMMIDLMLA